MLIESKSPVEAYILHSTVQHCIMYCSVYNTHASTGKSFWQYEVFFAKEYLFMSNSKRKMILSNCTCGYDDPWCQVFAGDAPGGVGALRHLQVQMQRTKWLTAETQHD